MEYIKEFMESLPTPKYKYNQKVLVVRGGELKSGAFTMYVSVRKKQYNEINK